MKRFKILAMLVAVVMVIGTMSLFAFAAERSGPVYVSVHSFSSEQLPEGSVTGNYGAAKSVDWDANTFWSDRYEVHTDPPNWIVYDLEGTFTVTAFKYLPRQDGWTGIENGSIREYELLWSTNGTDFTSFKTGSFDDTAETWQVSTFPGVSARYIKVLLPSDPAYNYVAIAEVIFTVQDAAPQTGDASPVLPILLAAGALLVLVLFGRKVASRKV